MESQRTIKSNQISNNKESHGDKEGDGYKEGDGNVIGEQTHDYETLGVFSYSSGKRGVFVERRLRTIQRRR